jgi:hypothetical protein
LMPSRATRSNRMAAEKWKAAILSRDRSRCMVRPARCARENSREPAVASRSAR